VGRGGGAFLASRRGVVFMGLGARTWYIAISNWSPEGAVYPSLGQRPGYNDHTLLPRAMPWAGICRPFRAAIGNGMIRRAFPYANAHWAVGPWRQGRSLVFKPSGDARPRIPTGDAVRGPRSSALAKTRLFGPCYDALAPLFTFNAPPSLLPLP
jgi:hypothetical protein